MGLILTPLLSRYGIGDDRLLCLDSKDGSTVAGQAEGLQPRTLEVFKSLGIADEILNEACQMWEVAFWNPCPEGIGRTNIVPNIGVPARYAQEFTVHQGRIERILKNDLARYSARVRYNTSVDSVVLDPESDTDYPVKVTIKTVSQETGTSYKKVRAKHLVGCDGAHSIVRKAFGLGLKGDTRDHIWGVVDLVVNTDFPDIRRRCAIHSDTGSVMVIPRERIPSGDYLTRLYIQVEDGVVDSSRPDSGVNGVRFSETELDARVQARQKRAQITLLDLLRKAQAALRPYRFAIKEGTEVDWWAAYQIGQRVADQFCVRDDLGIPRVLIAGDGESTALQVGGWTLLTCCQTSLPYALAQSWSGHECFHDGLLQHGLELRIPPTKHRIRLINTLGLLRNRAAQRSGRAD